MYKTSLNFNISCFRHRACAWIVLTAFFCSFLPSVSFAQQPTATISTLRGTVLVNGQQHDQGTVLSAGDVIETQSGSRVVLELSDGSLLEVSENTKLDIAALSQTVTGARTSRVKLWWGRLRAKLAPGHQAEGSKFDIETPNALVGVKFSQPDVEVSYDPANAETVALALTVALAVKNFVTDEEKIIPIGSIAIITALGIKVMSGAVATGVIVAETAAGVGATEAAATGAGTAVGAAQTGAATVAAAAGIGTGTMIAIGAGAAAAVGGVVAIAAGSNDNDDSDIDIIGLWDLYYDWDCDGDDGTATLDIKENNTIKVTNFDGQIDYATWSLNGNQFSFAHENSTTYTGTVNPEGTNMEGTMVSYDGGTGCWNATRTSSGTKSITTGNESHDAAGNRRK